MVLNPGKCYYMTSGLNTTKNDFVFKDGTIVPSVEEHVVLGITIDYRLTFYSHMKQLCKKVANKLNALARKKNFMATFYGWGSTTSRLEPLRGGSLLFTTKFSEISGTHFIDLGKMKR